MPRSLWKEFAADRIDHGELQHVIGRHFPSGSQPGIREVVYPGEAKYAIKLKFSKDDTLTSIEAGPLLTAALEATLIRAINDALVDIGPKVFRQVLFADHKLTGCWRYKDRFQVIPVPPQALQLNCLLGDHPFVLEIKIDRSKDGFVTNRRTAQVMRNTELLLAGLVNSSVHHLAARSFYGNWVRLPGDEHRAAYLYPYYPYAPQSTDDFTSTDNLAPVAPPRVLFAPFSMSLGTPFSVPDGLDEVLDAYHASSPKVQEQFLRSCYWLQRADRSFVESFSAAFMAVVTAAEALFESRPPEKCNCCGQPKYGLSNAFSQLIETHVPLPELLGPGHHHEQRNFRTRLKYLYSTRSKITHGGDLRGCDAKSPAFTPLESKDDDDLRTLLRIMPFALGEWLRERATTV
jgi:hypothetical protein